LSVVNGGSYEMGAVAAGQRIRIYGQRLAHAKVSIDGLAAQVLGASETEAEVLVPEELTGRVKAMLRVAHEDGPEETREVEVVAANPSVYAADQYGKGQAATAAASGDDVVIYVTGLGKDLPVSVTVGGHPAELRRMQDVGGKTELLIRVPDGLGSGMASIVVRSGEFSSQAGVTLAVR
jgi:uncharacterized protein (TIGR03437 family)